MNESGGQDEWEFESAVSALRGALDRIAADDRADLDEQEPVGTLSRAEFMMDWLLGLMGTVDRRLVSTETVNQLRSNLDSATAQVDALPSDPNALGALHGHLDQIALNSSPIVSAAGPSPRLTAEAGKKIGRVFSARSTRISGALDDVENRIEQMRNDLDQVRSQATSEDEERSRQANERLDQIKAQFDAEQSRINELVGQFETQHQDAQNQRQSEHNEVMESLRTENQTAIDELRATTKATLEEAVNEGNEASKSIREQGEEALAAMRADGDAAISHLREVEQKVDDLYEVIAKKGMSGAFQQEAKNQARAANTWRWISIAFGVLAVGVGVLSAFIIDPDDFGWEQLVAKLAVTIGLGAIAGYAGQQSGRHRRQAELAKNLELDLAAIGPFLSEIDDDAQRAEAQNAFIKRWMDSRDVKDGGDSNSEFVLAPGDIASVLRLASRDDRSVN